MTDFDNEDEDSQLDAAIRLCGLFEAELLVELMLRYWQHPNADDREFVNFLVEAGAEMLERSKRGEQFFEDLQPQDMNFIAAIWYVESCQIAELQEHDAVPRRAWLEKVRRSVPASFCDPSDLL